LLGRLQVSFFDTLTNQHWEKGTLPFSASKEGANELEHLAKQNLPLAISVASGFQLPLE